MIRATSVCAMSRRRLSPLRVWLRPTTVAPASAAPPNANRYSGVLSSSTPTWNGPSGLRARNRLAQRRALATYSPCVQTLSSNRMAGRPAIVWSRALRRRRAAAFGAGNGAWPGAGTSRCFSVLVTRFVSNTKARNATDGADQEEGAEHGDPNGEPAVQGATQNTNGCRRRRYRREGRGGHDAHGGRDRRLHSG